MANNNEFGGLIRGFVADNNDPLKLGRLKVRVEAAYGAQSVENLPWAWPCFAYGGMSEMSSFAVPEIGAGVWIMFQTKDGQPDTTFPVWLGVWQAQNETPSEIEDAVNYKEFKTKSGHYLLFCDKSGEEFIEIRDKNDSYILMKDGNIEIHAAKNIKITASRIDLN